RRILLGEEAGEDAGDREQRADRQVDAGGEDGEGHADGDNADDRDLQQDQKRAVGRAELPDLPGEPGDERGQRETEAVVAPRLGERQAARLRPVRAAGHALALAVPPRPAARPTRISSVAAARSTSPASAPSRITSTRSLMPRISGSSEEISITARPSRASRSMVAWTSALATTSMPRVGSSSTRIFGPTISERPSTTFCWLPPERLSTSWAGEEARIISPSIRRATWPRSRSASTKPRRQSPANALSDRLVRTESIGTSPRARRSSGAMAMPWLSARPGERTATDRPSTRISPASAGATPDSASARLVRPDPISP